MDHLRLPQPPKDYTPYEATLADRFTWTTLGITDLILSKPGNDPEDPERVVFKPVIMDTIKSLTEKALLAGDHDAPAKALARVSLILVKSRDQVRYASTDPTQLKDTAQHIANYKKLIDKTSVDRFNKVNLAEFHELLSEYGDSPDEKQS